YHNNHNGTFTDVAAHAGVNHVGFVKGVASADYDRDGWPDLFVSTSGRKVLYHNNGNGTFTDVAARAGITEDTYTFGTFFFDYDNDGWPDLCVMDYNLATQVDPMLDVQPLPVTGPPSHLYRNNGDGTFADVTKAVRLDHILLGMGHNFGDLDN